ncbi:unnamed protein product [Parajaminaea phylloscopi]
MPALFEPAHSSQIKAWLTRELGPICDAEPDVLADYVIALLKHDASEADLSSLLNEQLADFLDDKTSPFVAQLVSTLADKSYLPAHERPSTSQGQASSSEQGAAKSRKRAADDDEAAPPTKTARTSDIGQVDPPRGPAADSAGGSRERDVRENNGGRQAPVNGQGPPQAQQKKPKDLCRDFHMKGYCSRGDGCRYEHSTDAITGAMGGNGPMPPGFMGMPPQQMNPAHNRQMNQGMRASPGGHGSPPPGSAPQGFMGRPPAMPMGYPMQFPPQWNGHMPQQGPMGMPGPQFQGPGQAQQMTGPGDASGPHSLANRLGEQQSPSHPPSQQYGNHFVDAAQAQAQRGGLVGRGGRGGARGGRGGGAPGQFQSRSRSSTTLVIENVPSESLDLIKINDYFKRFGTITNIQIDQPSSKALVSYSDANEAKAAHESPDVIFGNRFVKVYFQKLDEPLGAAGGPASRYPGGMQPRPPPAVRPTFAAGQNVYRPPGAAAPAEGASAAPQPTEEQIAQRQAAMDRQRSAQDKVNQLLTEQKQLLVKVTAGGASPEEKKDGMAQLKALEPSIKEATEEVRSALQAVQALPALPSASRPRASAFDPAKRQEQKAKMEREQLDRELEAHSSSSHALTSDGSTATDAASGGQTAELRAKLEALKAEASALGMDQSNGSGGSTRGGYRGRGRGGPSHFRGGARGGASMRLDNRSTKLNVFEIPEGREAQRVKEWLKSFGEVASFDDGEGAISGQNSTASSAAFAVTFKQRHAAEAAVRALIQPDYEVPDVGRVKLVWAPAPTLTTSNQPSATGSPTPTTATQMSGQGAEEGGNAGGGGGGGDDGDDENWKR